MMPICQRNEILLAFLPLDFNTAATIIFFIHILYCLTTDINADEKLFMIIETFA